MYKQLVFFAMFFLAGCTSQKTINSCGVVVHSTRIQQFGSEVIEYPELSADTRTWYLKNYIIQAIPLIRTFDSATVHKWRVDTLYYTFLDLTTKNYFRYSSFSDTAKMIQCCYTTTDSLGFDGGWDFFYKPAIKQKLETFSLTDTIISKVSYKRVVSFRNRTLPDGKTVSEPAKVFYLNTFIKDSMFTLNHHLSSELGHPVTRIEQFDQFKESGVKFKWIHTITFEARSLTSFEKKVFARWIENARKNPVKFNAAYDSINMPIF
jgi:hypothetical protein